MKRVAGKWLTSPHAPVREMQSPVGKTARGWFSSSGALEKIGDLLQALLAVWEKDIAGKVAGGECFLTTISVFLPWL